MQRRSEGWKPGPHRSHESGREVEFFKFLVKLGFKQIEVGFPAASKTEYQFLRKLVDDKLIPDDVMIQVLTQSRKHIIKKTFESLAGVKRRWSIFTTPHHWLSVNRYSRKKNRRSSK